MRESTMWVEFLGLKILLIADDCLVDPSELKRADVAVRVCPSELSSIPCTPSAFIVKNFPGGVVVGS